MSRRFRICMAKGGRESLKPSYGWPKLTLISRGKKTNKKGVPRSLQAAILTLEPNPPERIFLYILKKSSPENFALKSKLRLWYSFQHRQRYSFLTWNKGQLWAAVTRPCRLSIPLCHTYSEPSGHEDSPGGTQNIPYLFKNLSKSRLSDPFFGLFFWWFLRSGARFT